MSRPAFPDFPEFSALVAGRGEGVTGTGPEGTSAGEKVVYVHPVEESHQRPRLSQPTLVGCWPGSSDPEEEAGLPTSAIHPGLSHCPQQNPGANRSGQVPEAAGLSEWKCGRRGTTGALSTAPVASWL